MIDFAVVIPTQRRRDMLAAAVESVLRQSYPAAEIVVVRDGPEAEIPDFPPEANVRVLDRAKEGVAAARNAGIAATSAGWLCFLDDDDLWHPDRLRMIADYIAAHPDCMAAQAGWWSFAAQSIRDVDIVASTLDECLAQVSHVAPRSKMDYLDITGRSFDLLLERNRSAISTVTVRRDVLEQSGGFPHGYTCAEDWVMAINVARYAEWHFCNQRLSFVRRHDSNNTISNPTNGIVTIRAIRRIWFDTTRPVPLHRPLSSYAFDYRVLVQRTFWEALGRRDTAIAREALAVGFDLLPRWRDRCVVLVPLRVNFAVTRARRRARSRLCQWRSAAPANRVPGRTS